MILYKKHSGFNNFNNNLNISIYNKKKSFNNINLTKKKMNNKFLKFIKQDNEYLFDNILYNNNNFLFNKSLLNLTHYKELVKHFLIKKGKSKKLQYNTYKSYTYISKYYPKLDLPTNINLFFNSYSFIFEYVTEYPIFRKRRSKKPFFQSTWRTIVEERKSIFNFFKDYFKTEIKYKLNKRFHALFFRLASNKIKLYGEHKKMLKNTLSCFKRWDAWRWRPTKKNFDLESMSEYALQYKKIKKRKKIEYQRQWKKKNKWIKLKNGKYWVKKLKKAKYKARLNFKIYKKQINRPMIFSKSRVLELNTFVTRWIYRFFEAFYFVLFRWTFSQNYEWKQHFFNNFNFSLPTALYAESLFGKDGFKLKKKN